MRCEFIIIEDGSKVCGDRCLNHRSPLPVQGEAVVFSYSPKKPDGLNATISENRVLAVSLRLQARKKSCSEWPLLNRRLPMVQGRSVTRRSWQGRKSQSNSVDLVTVSPLLPIQSLKAKAGKEVAGVSK